MKNPQPVQLGKRCFVASIILSDQRQKPLFNSLVYFPNLIQNLVCGHCAGTEALAGTAPARIPNLKSGSGPAESGVFRCH